MSSAGSKVPEVLLSVQSGVATITLQAPYRRNALTLSMVTDLVDLFDYVEKDAAIGVVILNSEGPVFCGGADKDLLAQASQDPAASEAYRAVGAIYESFLRFGHLGLPSIAAVQGAAVGAGLNLALAADIRIVARDAILRSGFASLQLHPGGGHFALLGRLGGREVASALGVFGEELTGERAAAIGLAWRAVESEEVLREAQELAAPLGRDPELARQLIASFRDSVGPPPISWDAAVQLERARQMWSLRRRS